MADRFFGFDDDEEEEEEEEVQEEEQKVEQPAAKETPKVDMSIFSKHHEDKRRVLTEKERTWNKFRSFFNSIIDNLLLSKFSTAYRHFQDFQKFYTKAVKVIEDNGVPNFFIQNLAEINNQISAMSQDNSSKYKELPRFLKELV